MALYFWHVDTDEQFSAKSQVGEFSEERLHNGNLCFVELSFEHGSLVSFRGENVEGTIHLYTKK